MTSRSLEHAPRAAGLAAVVVGGLVLAGWALDVAVLKSGVPGWVTVKPNTALGFILVGSALLFFPGSSASPESQLEKVRYHVAQLAALAAGLIGLLTLSEYIFSWNGGFDNWLFPEASGTAGTSHPGRMAPDTALCFVMLSAAVWIAGATRRERWWLIASAVLGSLVVIVAGAGGLAYLTPALRGDGWGGLTVMSPLSAAVFTACSVSIVANTWRLAVDAGLTHFESYVWQTAGVAGALGVAFALYARSVGEISRANELRYRSFVLADELRQSGDDLTRMVRTFVVTGDPVYRQRFQDILDIRDGRISRPIEISRPYWDLILGDGVPPRASGPAVPLLQLMRQAGVTEAEFGKLAQAKAASDSLTIPELEAMRLVEARGPHPEADRTRARAMVHDEAYHRAKVAVMRPIYDFLVLVDERTLSTVRAAQRTASILLLVFVTLGVALIFMLRRTYLVLGNALGGSVDEVSAHIARIGAGDLARRIPVKTGREDSVLGWLSVSQARLNDADRERRRYDEALRESEARFRATFEQSAVGMAHVAPDGRWLHVNEKVCQITGYPRDELIRLTFQDITHPADLDADLSQARRLLNGEITEYSIEKRYVRKDGQLVWINLTGSLVRDPNGKPQYFIAVIDDISDRKRAEVRLRWLTMAVEQSPVAVIITNPNGTIEYVNRTFTEVSGYSAAEAIGQTPRLIKSSQTPLDVHKNLWATVRAGEVWSGELRNRRKSGALYWAALRISPIRDPHGMITHFVGLQEDITERKLLEQASTEREERFRQLAENITEVFFVMNAGNHETLYVNRAYESIWRHSRQDLYDNPDLFLEAVHSDDRARVLEYLGQVRQSSNPGEIEHRVVQPDGRVTWVLTRAVPVRDKNDDVYRIAGVSRDVTERREAIAALRENERRARSLFDTVRLIVLGLDATGRVDYVNPFFLELTGFTRDEVIGEDWIERFIPDGQRAETRTVFEGHLANEAHAHHQNRILTRSGNERTIVWNNTVLRDLEGRPTGTLSIGDDVTEAMQLQQQLLHSQKMESVGRLAGGVAHDFNNLLTVIMSNAEFVLDGLPPDSPMRADTDEIRNAADRAAALTRQLLAFARHQVVQPRRLSLNVIVAGMEKMLRRLIDEDIELVTSFAPDPWSVLADPGQIEQIIANLAVNARDAMPAGGQLTIETTNVILSHEYASTHADVSPGDYVTLTVTDTGLGMSEEVRQRIFEPFFTTKPEGLGTGLGLATVHGIVRQAQGHLWVYSEPGHGTTFKVYLPRAEGEAAATAVRQLEPARGGMETVLLVEDDPQLRSVAARTLIDLGYNVLQAQDGLDALRVSAQCGQDIDLLVTDIVMPRMGGRELAALLSGKFASLRVLYSSGYTGRSLALDDLLVANAAFLAKPFVPADLAHKVRLVLDAPRET